MNFLCQNIYCVFVHNSPRNAEISFALRIQKGQKKLFKELLFSQFLTTSGQHWFFFEKKITSITINEQFIMWTEWINCQKLQMVLFYTATDSSIFTRLNSITIKYHTRLCRIAENGKKDIFDKILFVYQEPV